MHIKINVVLHKKWLLGAQKIRNYLAPDEKGQNPLTPRKSGEQREVLFSAVSLC